MPYTDDRVTTVAASPQRARTALLRTMRTQFGPATTPMAGRGLGTRAGDPRRRLGQHCQRRRHGSRVCGRRRGSATTPRPPRPSSLLALRASFRARFARPRPRGSPRQDVSDVPRSSRTDLSRARDRERRPPRRRPAHAHRDRPPSRTSDLTPRRLDSRTAAQVTSRSSFTSHMSTETRVPGVSEASMALNA